VICAEPRLSGRGCYLEVSSDGVSVTVPAAQQFLSIRNVAKDHT